MCSFIHSNWIESNRIESNWIESNSFIWIDFRLMNKHTWFFSHFLSFNVHISLLHMCVGVCVFFFHITHPTTMRIEKWKWWQKKIPENSSTGSIRRFHIVTIVRENLFFFLHSFRSNFSKRKTTNKYDKLNCDNIDWWNIFFFCMWNIQSCNIHCVNLSIVVPLNIWPWLAIRSISMIVVCSFTIYLSYGNSWEM